MKHVAIIGGGVIGLCTAYYLAKRGHRVTVIDRASESELGCSYGNAGMITPSHFVPLAAPGALRLALKWMWNPESPFYMKPRLDALLVAWAWNFFRAATVKHVVGASPLLLDLNLKSRDLFVGLAKEWGDFEIQEKGILMVCRTEKGMEHERATAKGATELGLPVEVLDAKAIAAMEPGLRMTVAGGIYFPKDAYLAPWQFMAALKKRVPVKWMTSIRLRPNGRRIESELNADEYVIAGGAWSTAIARELKLRLPMQSGKGYSLTVQRPRAMPAHAMILSEARVAITPMLGALRFGGTMEITGTSLSINPARVRGIIKAVPAYLPDFSADDFRDVQPWAGLRPVSPDGVPYIGRFSRYDNLSAATGHAMMGLSLGPITGKLMTEVLSGDAPSIPLTRMSPDRYA